MKRENIITILVVVFVVLLGVLYLKNEQHKELSFIQNQIRESQMKVKEVSIEDNKQEIKETLPELVQEPYTKESCLQFIKNYHCQEGTETSEGLVDCNPEYQRTETRCDAFLKGEADPYGENYGIKKKKVIHKKEDSGLVLKDNKVCCEVKNNHIPGGIWHQIIDKKFCVDTMAYCGSHKIVAPNLCGNDNPVVCCKNQPTYPGSNPSYTYKHKNDCISSDSLYCTVGSGNETIVSHSFCDNS